MEGERGKKREKERGTEGVRGGEGKREQEHNIYNNFKFTFLQSLGHNSNTQCVSKFSSVDNILYNIKRLRMT